MANYDSTKYRDKESHANPYPVGSRSFGDEARLRRARLMEDAANNVRPDPRSLGTGMAANAGESLRKRRKAIEDSE